MEMRLDATPGGMRELVETGGNHDRRRAGRGGELWGELLDSDCIM